MPAMSSRFAAVIAGATLVILLTGCTPRTEGSAGIALIDGVPSMVLESCSVPVTAAILYTVDSEGSVAESVADWGFDGSSSRLIEPLLEDVGDLGDQTYELRAWSTDSSPFGAGRNGVRLDSVQFDKAQLDALQPDEVLYRSPDTSTTATVPLTQFSSDACSQ